jgi:emp24/gp25L/p24 family/GOLD.
MKLLLFFTFLCTTSFTISRHIQFYLNGYECFYQEIRAGTKCSLEYAPISGSKPHVDVTVEDPNQYVFYRKNEQEYDYFHFDTNVTGTYRICFSNIYDLMMYNNVVYLDFVVGEEGKMVRLKDGLNTPMTQVETSIVNIYDAMKVVELYQNHHRIREANGRLVAQSLNVKVMMWSLGQGAAFVLIGCIQVYILRQFFTSRKDEI